MKNLICSLCLTAVSILDAKAFPSSSVAEGKKVFETSCAVGYCHGVDGRAGKGPRLQGRVWSKSYLYKTIEQGIPGSSMPAWHAKLPEEKIAAVISYILSISQEDPASANKVKPAVARESSVNAEMPGRTLFFDLMRDRNCGVCHRISDAGGGIAPPFASLRGMSTQSLLNRIQSQPVSESNIEVHLSDGEAFCGFRAGEDHNSVRIYDLAGEGPPVLRTVDKGAILDTQPCQSLNVHSINAQIYSSAELMRIVEFLIKQFALIN